VRLWRNSQTVYWANFQVAVGSLFGTLQVAQTLVTDPYFKNALDAVNPDPKIWLGLIVMGSLSHVFHGHD